MGLLNSNKLKSDEIRDTVKMHNVQFKQQIKWEF